MPSDTPPRLNLITASLAWLALCSGAGTIVAAIYIGIRAYTPVLFADEWQVPMDYMIAGGHYGLAKLWAQHNEHRIPFQKLLQLADMFWWKTDHRPLLILGWLVQGAQCAAAAFFLKRTAKLSRAEFLTALGLLAFFLFNPNQMQIFEWAFSPSFLGAFFCALVAFGALAMYSTSGHRRWLALTVISAFLSECNLANGVLVWVMLPLCALFLKLRWRYAAGLAFCGASAIGLYLIGYKSPSNASNPWDAVRHPVDVFAFCQAYFAESWRHIAPALGNPAATFAIAVVPVIALYHLRPGKQRDPASAWVLSLACMMLLTSFITALGRQISGVDQAREGRYQVAAMLFWSCSALLLMLQMKHLGRFRTYALVAFQILFLSAAVAESRAIPRFLRQYDSDGFNRSLAGLAYEAGIFDAPVERMIYPYPPAVPPTYNYLRAQHWISPPFPVYNAVGKPLAQIFTTPAAEKCSGYIDEIRILNNAAGARQLVARGWAYSNTHHVPIERMLAVSEAGQILGIGISGEERPDIPKVLPEITSPDTGWRLYAVAPPQAAQLLVYGIVAGTNQVCQLPNVKPIPQ